MRTPSNRQLRNKLTNGNLFNTKKITLYLQAMKYFKSPLLPVSGSRGDHRKILRLKGIGKIRSVLSFD